MSVDLLSKNLKNVRLFLSFFFYLDAMQRNLCSELCDHSTTVTNKCRYTSSIAHCFLKAVRGREKQPEYLLHSWQSAEPFYESKKTVKLCHRNYQERERKGNSE